MRPIAALRSYVRNARLHSPEQIDRLKASIERWGWTVPVLVTPDGEIIAGHGRVEAAKALGIESAPVMIAEGWSDEQRRAYVIADNRLAEQSEWDRDLLASEMRELGSAGFDLTDIGFAGSDLDALLLGRKASRTEPDDAPEPPPAPVSRAGDVWILGEHRLVCGDSTRPEAVALALDGVAPNLMVTDPPYGVEYDPDWRNHAAVVGFGDPEKARTITARATGKVMNDHRADWREAWALFPGAVAYVWHASTQSGDVIASLKACQFEIRAQIIWAKSNPVIGRGAYHYQHEPCFFAVRKGRTASWTGDRKQTTLWQISHRRSTTGHGTQKPVDAMRRPMLNHTKAGEFVYEPFCGSGTTIIAGEMEGRRVRALELDPAYVDVIVRRWEEFSGAKAKHGCGASLDEIAAERAAEDAA